VNDCLSFLTGDLWDVSFTEGDSNLVRPRRTGIRRRRRRIVSPPSGDAVSLFSGGLDSLIGVIDWLATHGPRRLLVVGHHDGDMAGPYSDQRGLLDPLRDHYRTG